MGNNLLSLREEIVEIGRRVYNRGFVASNDGNISARIDSNRILITPTGVSKGFMKAEDLIIVDNDGNLLVGSERPSSETGMHTGIYRNRPDVNSVRHTHPPCATVFAVAGIFYAYNKMETLEHSVKIHFLARQLGDVNTLNKEQAEQSCRKE